MTSIDRLIKDIKRVWCDDSGEWHSQTDLRLMMAFGYLKEMQRALKEIASRGCEDCDHEGSLKCSPCIATEALEGG